MRIRAVSTSNSVRSPIDVVSFIFLVPAST